MDLTLPPVTPEAKWPPAPDLNREPSEPKSDALPIALAGNKKWKPLLELNQSPPLQGRVYEHYIKGPKRVGAQGLEPLPIGFSARLSRCPEY